jgi:hypothetical protein
MKKTSERYIGFPVAMLEGKSLEAQKGKWIPSPSDPPEFFYIYFVMIFEK